MHAGICSLIRIVRVLLFGYVLIRIGMAGWLGLLNIARFGVLALKSGDAAVRGSFAASRMPEADTDCDQLDDGVGVGYFSELFGSV
ncbi:hypothetical protein Nepgr_023950 [Nepenthes gracilis]|uniref:Uncharacterized protein n=1 Tax=Nepenthes gracilis TaxID=150966 RepID=A0AAD3XY58_NEPGR|nr:hypothetical protein Nepgr_023950 [Nepenthes gracilis]